MLRQALRRLFTRRSASSVPPAAAARPDTQPVNRNWQQELLLLHSRGLHEEVAAGVNLVLAREPDNVDALKFLAATRLAQGKAGEGIAHLRRVAELQPDSAEEAHELAKTLWATGDVAGAIANFERALRLSPDHVHASITLTGLLTAFWRYDEAEDHCRRALAHAPGNAHLHKALGDVLFEQGRVDEAILALREAVALAPDDAVTHSDLLRMLSYSDSVTPAEVLAEHRAWAARHAGAFEAEAPQHANTPDPARRLRVGYVSPWFRKHAVTFFLESVIEHRDCAGFEVFLYADVAQPDEYSARLQSYGVVWRDTVRKSDAQLAATITEDAIDILVDLTGHTRGNRLLVFARRAAPIQVNWLGFPATTGLASMDYHVTDAYCDPPGATEHLYSEKLARLSGIYMAWRPPAHAPDIDAPPALVNGYVTFGSFGSCYKITPGLVALWSRILEAVPRSRLMMLAVDGEVARRRIRDLFAGHGIDAQRLEFVPRLNFDDYLAAHQRADIALDTFPYHGATTTCACLWMGLPVVVLAGENHASRADVSMLSHVGLPQFVADTGDAYVDIAARAAADLPALAALRARLRDAMQRSPNTDALACAHGLEALFRQMWVTWCSGRFVRK